MAHVQVGTFPFHTRVLGDSALVNAGDVLEAADILVTYAALWVHFHIWYERSKFWRTISTLKDRSKAVAQSVVSFIVTIDGVHVLSAPILSWEIILP